MSFHRFAGRLWDRDVPLSALIELTHRCNLQCPFCCSQPGEDPAGTPLGRARLLRLLEELRALQTLFLTLSGGEPLLHPDLWAVGRQARELEFAVRLKTNGHALDEEVARRVHEEIAPFAVEISLHGATAATHDRHTGVPGSFERLRHHLDVAQRMGLRTTLLALVTRHNEDELDAMRALARGRALPLVLDPVVTPRHDGDPTPRDWAPTARGRARLRALLSGGDAPAPDSDEGARRRFCGAGASTLAVDPYGVVSPCVQWRTPVGDLHEQDLESIWRGPPMEEIRRLSEQARRDREARPGTALGWEDCPGIEHLDGHHVGCAGHGACEEREIEVE